MVKFEGRILQFGFGAVGKSFFEKIRYEVDFDEYNYYVFTREKTEFEAFINLGGIASNFRVGELNQGNYVEIFSSVLRSGDLLIDFADTVGTRDILKWCADNNIMYINTGEADWPYKWYCIFEENEKKCIMQKEYEGLNVPIVLQHGNNPGLVSHFVKAALEYIVETQFKNKKLGGLFSKNSNKANDNDLAEHKLDYAELKNMLVNNEYNKLAKALRLRILHVNDIDLQKVKDGYKDKKLYNTWCSETFLYELLSETAYNIGTHERLEIDNKCIIKDKEKGIIKLEDIAVNVKCNTIYPGGVFEGFVVPHEETITIAKGLECREGEEVYRPTVMFVYSPCEYATRYLENAKVNNYPNPDPDKPQDFEGNAEETIVHGHEYPRENELLYREKISEGTEYVGVLLLGENFDPVWVGNRVELSFLCKGKSAKKSSYWQTPTITPVAVSALAAVSWMLKNRDKGGIYFPDNIMDYKYIIKLAEKYISKTIYKTFTKEEVEKELGIRFNDLQMEDLWVKSQDCGNAN